MRRIARDSRRSQPSCGARGVRTRAALRLATSAAALRARLRRAIARAADRGRIAADEDRRRRARARRAADRRRTLPRRASRPVVRDAATADVTPHAVTRPAARRASRSARHGGGTRGLRARSPGGGRARWWEQTQLAARRPPRPRSTSCSRPATRRRSCRLSRRGRRSTTCRSSRIPNGSVAARACAAGGIDAARRTPGGTRPDRSRTFSRDEIVRLLGVPRSACTVIPPGSGGHVAALAAGRANACEAGPTRPLRRLDPQPAASPRRRSRLRAASRAAIPAARLVIVGENRTFPFEDPAATRRRAKASPIAGRRSRVCAATRSSPSCTAARRVFAFLSDVRGLRASRRSKRWRAGVPVVAYDTPVAREVYGDAALLVPIGRARR